MEVVTINTNVTCPSLAIDSSGNPYVLVVYGELLTLFFKVNSNWVCDTFETSASESSPDIAVDKNNTVWTIFRSQIDSTYLIVAYKNTSGWMKDTIDTGVNVDFRSKAIITDRENNPHITYDKHIMLPDERYGFYGYKEVFSWVIDTVPNSLTFGYCCAIDCDSFSQPHISWLRFELFPPAGIFHSHKMGSDWFSQQVEATEYPSLCPTSIRVGLNNLPVIVYENGTGWLNCAYYDGVSWHIDVVDSPGVIGTQKALDIDSLGKTYFVYNNNVAYKENGVWHIEPLPSLNPPLTSSRPGALRVGRDGTIHLTRLAANSDWSHREIHYIYGTTVGTEEEKSQSPPSRQKAERLKLNVTPNIVICAAQIQYIVPEKQRISLTLYDILGRLVAQIAEGVFKPGIYTHNLDASNLSSGIYFLVLEGEKERKTEKLLIVR